MASGGLSSAEDDTNVQRSIFGGLLLGSRLMAAIVGRIRLEGADGVTKGVGEVGLDDIGVILVHDGLIDVLDLDHGGAGRGTYGEVVDLVEKVGVLGLVLHTIESKGSEILLLLFDVRNGDLASIKGDGSGSGTHELGNRTKIDSEIKI